MHQLVQPNKQAKYPLSYFISVAKSSVIYFVFLFYFLKVETSRTKLSVIIKIKLTVYDNKKIFQSNANHPPSGHVRGGLCTVRYNLKNSEHVQGEQDPVEGRRQGAVQEGWGQASVWWGPPSPVNRQTDRHDW